LARSTGFSSAATRPILAHEADSRMAETAIAQRRTFALQAWLTTVLRERGITPSALIGHSGGEGAAARASGAFDLPEACGVIHERGMAIELSVPSGAMMSLWPPHKDAVALPAVRDGRLEIAAFNGRRTTALSNCAKNVAKLQRDLRAQGLAGRRLLPKHAFRSRLPDPSRDQASAVLGAITPRATTSPLFSIVTDGPIAGADLTPAGWWRTMRRLIRLRAGGRKRDGPWPLGLCRDRRPVGADR
jgi:acyl transferase domain-containing protein